MWYICALNDVLLASWLLTFFILWRLKENIPSGEWEDDTSCNERCGRYEPNPYSATFVIWLCSMMHRARTILSADCFAGFYTIIGADPKRSQHFIHSERVTIRDRTRWRLELCLIERPCRIETYQKSRQKYYNKQGQLVHLLPRSSKMLWKWKVGKRKNRVHTQPLCLSVAGESQFRQIVNVHFYLNYTCRSRMIIFVYTR